MITSAEFIHPEDAAALQQMENIPGFPTLVKKILSLGYEQLQYGVNMASNIRLSETQLPKISNNVLHSLMTSLNCCSVFNKSAIIISKFGANLRI